MKQNIPRNGRFQTGSGKGFPGEPIIRCAQGNGIRSNDQDFQSTAGAWCGSDGEDRIVWRVPQPEGEGERDLLRMGRREKEGQAKKEKHGAASVGEGKPTI